MINRIEPLSLWERDVKWRDARLPLRYYIVDDYLISLSWTPLPFAKFTKIAARHKEGAPWCRLYGPEAETGWVTSLPLYGKLRRGKRVSREEAAMILFSTGIDTRGYVGTEWKAQASNYLDAHKSLLYEIRWHLLVHSIIGSVVLYILCNAGIGISEFQTSDGITWWLTLAGGLYLAVLATFAIMLSPPVVCLVYYCVNKRQH